MSSWTREKQPGAVFMYHRVSVLVHLVRSLLDPLDTFHDRECCSFVFLTLNYTTGAAFAVKEPLNVGVFPTNEFH